MAELNEGRVREIAEETFTKYLREHMFLPPPAWLSILGEPKKKVNKVKRVSLPEPPNLLED